MCFFRRKKKKKEAQEQQRISHEELKKQSVERALADQTEQPVKAKEPVAKKAVENNKTEDVVQDNPTKTSASKYHVSQNKDEKSEHFKSWRVRKEGSQKTIKFFLTQLEAIEYAQDLADKAGTTIVIHKVDGSIRKQNYTKK